MEPLFKVPNPMDRIGPALGGAQQAYGAMQPNIEPPGKSVGGGIMNAMGGAGTAAAMGSALEAAGSTALAGSVAGLPGLVVGAGVGLLAYLLS